MMLKERVVAYLKHCPDVYLLGLRKVMKISSSLNGLRGGNRTETSKKLKESANHTTVVFEKIFVKIYGLMCSKSGLRFKFRLVRIQGSRLNIVMTAMGFFIPLAATDENTT